MFLAHRNVNFTEGCFSQVKQGTLPMGKGHFIGSSEKLGRPGPLGPPGSYATAFKRNFEESCKKKIRFETIVDITA